MSKRAKIKFAIIGCGRIAQRHAKHADHFGDLTAVCDIEFSKATELGEQYNATPYATIAELLGSDNKVDVIAICTPNGLHAEHTIRSLKEGYHVLCEKPMAINVNDCTDMIIAADKSNRRLFIVKQNRFNPPIAALKKVIDEGRLGQLLSVQLNCFWNRNDEYYNNSWKGTRDLDGGTLFTQFSHFIDLLYFLIGDVKKVSAIVSNHLHKGIIDFADQGVAIMEFYNGVQGALHFTVNSHAKNMEGSITIFGEKGTVKVGGQYLNELEYQNIADYEITDLPKGNPPNEYGQYQGSMSNHDDVYQNVVEVITGNGVISANGSEGLKTVEIIEKIYSAAENA